MSVCRSSRHRGRASSVRAVRGVRRPSMRGAHVVCRARRARARGTARACSARSRQALGVTIARRTVEAPRRDASIALDQRQSGARRGRRPAPAAERVQRPRWWNEPDLRATARCRAPSSACCRARAARRRCEALAADTLLAVRRDRRRRSSRLLSAACRRAPRRADLRLPRQILSTGRPRATAAAGQCQLEDVQVRLGRAQLGVRQRAVGGRIAARDRRTGDRVEAPAAACRLDAGAHRSEDRRHAAARAHRAPGSARPAQLGARRLALGDQLAIATRTARPRSRRPPAAACSPGSSTWRGSGQPR